MLTELFVKNFALIDEIRLSFGKGFSIISGETGAGKSILVGALGLAIGGRASPTMIRTGEKEAVIEAVFDTGDHTILKVLLEEWSLNDNNQVLIRRHLSAEGKNRIYVNGQSASLSQLEKIGSFLVDLAGQHDQQILLNEENHLPLLDGTAPLKKEYALLYAPYESLARQIAEEEKKLQARDQRLDYLKFQLAEIDKAGLKTEGEEEELLSEKARTKNAAFFAELSSQAEQTLDSGETSVQSALDALCSKLDKARNLDATLEKPLNLIREAKVLLLEAAGCFSNDPAEADPARLEEIEARLFLIHQLKKKHGGSLSEVLTKAQTLRDELKNLTNLEDVLTDRRKELKVLGDKVFTKAAELSEWRKKQARALSKAVEKELADLSMLGVKFHVHVSHPEKPAVADCGADGFDKVRFDLSANAGEDPKPLSQIASGGELSRIFLAIKKIVGGKNDPMTLIFDEIDSGIGGGVAEVVGKKLKEMSGRDQVLVVTHLPQVASQADEHYVIEKGKTGERTRTRVKTLESAGERETEIARMLGGVSISDKARAHAREMLRAK